MNLMSQSDACFPNPVTIISYIKNIAGETNSMYTKCLCNQNHSAWFVLTSPCRVVPPSYKFIFPLLSFSQNLMVQCYYSVMYTIAFSGKLVVKHTIKFECHAFVSILTITTVLSDFHLMHVNFCFRLLLSPYPTYALWWHSD